MLFMIWPRTCFFFKFVLIIELADVTYFYCISTEPRDGKWSAWGPWSPCSKTCGSGMRTRERACDNPTPAHGGADCQGVKSETQGCFDRNCSSKLKLTVTIKCAET